MKKAISIPDLIAGEKSTEENGIEFTHAYSTWIKTSDKPQDHTDIVYLGKCDTDGDMFSAKDVLGNILIFKGHLNNGTY